MTTYIDQAGLTERYGAGGLARLASPIATLNAEAVARIAKACDDANAQVDAVVSGLSLDLSGPPAKLISIAARLAARGLWVLTWSTRVATGVPKAFADAANEAETELEAVRTGQVSGDGAVTPAQTVAGSFSWQNIADEPATDNPRQTVRARMRRLP